MNAFPTWVFHAFAAGTAAAGIAAVGITAAGCKSRAYNASEVRADAPENSAFLSAAIPINKTGITDTDFKDFDKLPPSIFEAQLIGLGEATHGTADFNHIRARFFRYLVERKGFRIFILEDEASSYFAMQAFLHGRGSLEQALKALRAYGTWGTDENIELFKWIAAFNSAHPKDPIIFFGVDMQDSITILESLKQATTEFTDKTKKKLVDVERLLQEKGNMFTLLQAKFQFDPKAYVHVSRAIPKEIVELKKLAIRDAKNLGWTSQNTSILEVIVHALSQANDNFSFFSKSVMSYLAQGLTPEQIKQALIWKAAMPQDLVDGDTFALRDKAMHDNTITLLKIFGNKKGVYWAHNGHVSNYLHHPEIIRYPGENELQVNKSITATAGGNLRATLKEKYACLMTEFSHGEFSAQDASQSSRDTKTFSIPARSVNGTLLGELGKVPHESFFVSWRAQNLPAEARRIVDSFQDFHFVAAGFNPNKTEEVFYNGILSKNCDHMIFVQKTSAPTFKYLHELKLPGFSD